MQSDLGQYYLGHQKLPFIGIDGQQLIQKNKVLVIGAGGLGCPCLQYLAGCGIGVIGIADYDIVSVSNLHRQILFNVNDVGRSKVFVAKEKLSLYNSAVNFIVHDILVDDTNILSLISEYDVVVDCTDNFQVRYLINDACVVLDKPLVYGAIHQAEGHVTVFNYNESPTLRCLFPEEDNTAIQSCADIGAYNITTGIIGLMIANEVIKIILKHVDVLASILYQLDTLTGRSRQIKYQSLPDSRVKSAERFMRLNASIEISSNDFANKIANKSPFILIDVRESDERELFNIGGEHIPLQIFLKQDIFPFSISDTIILYCQKGTRSLTAAQFLINKGFIKTFSLKGGIENYSPR